MKTSYNIKSSALRREPILKKIIDTQECKILEEVFNHLPQDPYVTEGFRYKAISRYRVSENSIVKQKYGVLYQSRDYNPIHGDISREYDEILTNGKINRLLTKILLYYKQLNNLAEEEILVKFQRIRASTSLAGQPAIEGWHKDGVDNLSTLCVRRYNIKGGCSLLKTNDDDDIIFSKILYSGEMLTIDDRHYFHNVTPIMVNDVSLLDAYRDIMIICNPSCRK